MLEERKETHYSSCFFSTNNRPVSATFSRMRLLRSACDRASLFHQPFPVPLDGDERQKKEEKTGRTSTSFAKSASSFFFFSRERFCTTSPR